MNIWGVEAIMGVDNIVTRVCKVTREGQGRDMMGREGKKRKEKRKEGKEKNTAGQLMETEDAGS